MQKELPYRGFVMAWEEPPQTTGGWPIAIASEDRILQAMLEVSTSAKGAHVITGSSKENGIAAAKVFVDALLD